MNRRLGYASLVVGIAVGALAYLVQRSPGLPVASVSVEFWVLQILYSVAVILGAYGVYTLLAARLIDRSSNKRRRHNVRNVLRLVVTLATAVAVLGILTEQWLGVLFSLGIVGIAITFALQEPLFSLIGWSYIMVKHPYGVGDRVAIEQAKGDVVAVDFFVTTLWEIDGELVSSNQPSGRLITVPNSVVLSANVYNYSWEKFPYVWNEIAIQVAYETDLAFARERMTTVADEYLGDEMARRVEQYRSQLATTPVELEVQERPTVNVAQQDGWVTLRLRYLVHPKRAQRVKNALYERVLAEFNAAPEKIKFPVGRHR